MSNRLRCPSCGIPTIEDSGEDITREEKLCEACYASEWKPKPRARRNATNAGRSRKNGSFPVFKYGGYGVDVKLQSMKTSPSVFWSKAHHSFVVVDDPQRGDFSYKGRRVSLISVNGIGEIRWKVRAPGSSFDGGDEAAPHFGLTPWASAGRNMRNAANQDPSMLMRTEGMYEVFFTFAKKTISHAGPFRSWDAAKSYAERYLVGLPGQRLAYHIKEYGVDFNPLTGREARKISHSIKMSHRMSERHPNKMFDRLGGKASVLASVTGTHAKRLHKMAWGYQDKIWVRERSKESQMRKTSHRNSGGSIAITTPEGIAAYRMLALKGMLKLEMLGMGRRGVSAFAIIKREFGLKGSKQNVFEQFQKICAAVVERRAKPPGFNPNKKGSSMNRKRVRKNVGRGHPNFELGNAAHKFMSYNDLQYQRLWRDVTLGEVFTMSGAAAAAYAKSVGTVRGRFDTFRAKVLELRPMVQTAIKDAPLRVLAGSFGLMEGMLASF